LKTGGHGDGQCKLCLDGNSDKAVVINEDHFRSLGFQPEMEHKRLQRALLPGWGKWESEDKV